MNTHTEKLPVVLLHGWPVTAYHWRYLVPALENAGFEAIPLTLPGLGSADEQPASYRKTDLARWLREELARRGISRFALVGHDWGATIAVLLAAELREAVPALVVEEEVLPGIAVNIPQPGREHYPTWHGSFNAVENLAERLIVGREEAYYGAFLSQSAGPAGLTAEAMSAYLQAYSAEDVSMAGLSYYRARELDVCDVQGLEDARLESTAVLAIGGRFAMGSAVADGMRFLARDVTGVVLSDSGHYPLEQEPALGARAVVEFLAKHCANVASRGASGG